MEEIGVADVLRDWRLDPVAALAIAVLAAAYLRGLLRFDQQHDRRWPVGRVIWFGGAVVALVVATQSGIGRCNDHASCDQHLLIGMLAPVRAGALGFSHVGPAGGAPGTRRAVRRALHSPVVRFLASRW